MVQKGSKTDTVSGGRLQNHMSYSEKLKRLLVRTIEQILDAEMENNLGYVKILVISNHTRNSRNVYDEKTIITNMVDGYHRIARKFIKSKIIFSQTILFEK